MDDGTKPGRPLKFKSPEELSQKIDEYFGQCDPHLTIVKVKKINDKRKTGIDGVERDYYWTDQEVMTEQQPYTIHGLARALDTNRETLLDYESGKYDSEDLKVDDRQQFSDTIKRAKAKIAEFVETQLYKGQATGPIFNLKNNFGWVDKSVVETNSVKDDLDALDDSQEPDQRQDVAEQAKKALNEQPEPARPATT